MELFFNFDGEPINIFNGTQKFIIRACLLSDQCYYAEYISSITTVSIIEKSFFVRAFGDKMRIFKNPTRDEFLALGKIYKELLVADIMKK